MLLEKLATTSAFDKKNGDFLFIRDSGKNVFGQQRVVKKGTTLHKNVSKYLDKEYGPKGPSRNDMHQDIPGHVENMVYAKSKKLLEKHAGFFSGLTVRRLLKKKDA